MTERIGEGFAREIIEDSRQSIGGVGMPATSGDPQPALDLVEEGVEQPEEEGEIWEGEDTVDMVNALRDMFDGLV